MNKISNIDAVSVSKSNSKKNTIRKVRTKNLDIKNSKNLAYNELKNNYADYELENLTVGVPDTKLIAFFLPQFHPTLENDMWWGKGFTEWTNVVSAKAYFKEHNQPQLPADLGFYDLRLAETRDQQAALAKEYGVYGFCYYYYWFAGRKILEKPLDGLIKSGKPDFPFCICWANEPWSRRWDGSEKEVLIAQEHDPEKDKNFIFDVLPIIKDKRYIRINNAPLILVYRVALIPNARQLFEEWRKIAKEHDIPSIHVCMAETFGIENPYSYGCDSSVEFPPHGLWSGSINSEVDGLSHEYTGSIYDYRKIVKEEIRKPKPDYLRFRTVMPSWDNTSRRGPAGNVFAYSSPAQYEMWLRSLVQDAKTRSVVDERIVFVNAWNEWGEGAHLEPDRRYGRSYLEATRRSLFDQSEWRVALEQLELLQGQDNRAAQFVLESIRQRLLALEASNEFLSSIVESQDDSSDIVSFNYGMLYENLPVVNNVAVGYIEQINRYASDETPVLNRERPMHLKGWCYVPGSTLTPESLTFLSLLADDMTKIYSCVVSNREERKDVVEHFSASPDEAQWSGLEVRAKISAIPPGTYRIIINSVADKSVARLITMRQIIVI